MPTQTPINQTPRRQHPRLIALTLSMAFFYIYACSHQPQPTTSLTPTSDSTTASNQPTTIRLLVNGLTSPMGAQSVVLNLQSINAVQSAVVDMATGQVTIQLKPNASRPNDNQLKTAVESAGVTLKEILNP